MENLIEPIIGKHADILSENISKDEHLHIFMQGISKDQSLAATDKRIFIIKTGIAGGQLFVGRRCKVFPYEHITSIECSKGFLTGRLQITIAGSAESKDRYIDAFYAENAISFANNQYPKFQAVANTIRELMDAYKAQTRSPAIPTTESIPDQVKKLAELKDMGILTLEEFESKKAELLKRL